MKSVITNYLELGTRVAEDMVREAAEEEERRKEVEITKNAGQSMQQLRSTYHLGEAKD